MSWERLQSNRIRAAEREIRDLQSHLAAKDAEIAELSKQSDAVADALSVECEETARLREGLRREIDHINRTPPLQRSVELAAVGERLAALLQEPKDARPDRS